MYCKVCGCKISSQNGKCPECGSVAGGEFCGGFWGLVDQPERTGTEAGSRGLQIPDVVDLESEDSVTDREEEETARTTIAGRKKAGYLWMAATGVCLLATIILAFRMVSLSSANKKLSSTIEENVATIEENSKIQEENLAKIEELNRKVTSDDEMISRYQMLEKEYEEYKELHPETEPEVVDTDPAGDEDSGGLATMSADDPSVQETEGVEKTSTGVGTGNDLENTTQQTGGSGD